MGVEPDPVAFEEFKKKQTAAFSRIAYRTRGTHGADDLMSEAWLIALEIGKRRGCQMDVSNYVEQNLILAWLYKRFVDFVDGKNRESIDDDVSDGFTPLRDRLAAPEESNPLHALLLVDEERLTSPARKGFSQYSAYMILLERCELSLLTLAEYLAISFSTLRTRIQSSNEHADCQPSLFDEVERIDSNFLPRSQWLRTLWQRWQAKSAITVAWTNIRKLISRENNDVSSATIMDLFGCNANSAQRL